MPSDRIRAFCNHPLHFQKATFQSDHDGVRAITGVELRENVLQMIFHCVFRDIERVRDDFIGATLRNSTKYIKLADCNRIISRVLGDLLSDLRGGLE